MLNCKSISLLVTGTAILFSISVSAQSAAEKTASWKKVVEAAHDTSRAIALLDYGGLFYETNYDTAEFYYRQARDLSLKNNYFRGYQKYVSYQSEIFNMKGQFDSNINLCRRGLVWAEKNKDRLYQGTHLANIGIVYLYKANNDSAASYFIRATRFFEGSDSMRLGQVYSNLSVVFDNLGQYHQSIYYNRLALQIAKATNDELGVGYAMVNMGSALKKLNQYDSARYFFETALPIAVKHKHINLEKDANINLGYVELYDKTYNNAERYFLQGLILSRHLKNDYGIVASNKGLASVKIAQGKFDEAGELLKDAINTSKSIGFNNELQELYLLKYETEKASGNFANALEAYMQHVNVKDSLNNIQVQKNISSLEKQYQTERKEKMILQKDNQIHSQTLELKAKNTWILALVSLIIFLALISFLVWKYYKQKRLAKAKQQELFQVQLSMQAKEDERNRIAKELHDDLGGTLSGIVLHSHFMIEQLEDSNVSAVKKSIDRIQNASSEMITKLNDIVWLINPKYDTLEKLVQRIEEFAIDMGKAKGIQVKIDTPENSASISLDTHARKNIYLICKEAINNAVKYSNATELFLTISWSENNLHLQIEDNGNGFDATRAGNGNGLSNMKQRAQDIGAAYILDAINNKGTRVSLDYKIPQ
ncbi:MAG: tetratricopeptide repeat-containing sensor histidine kinase [Flavisolibacter sp.]